MLTPEQIEVILKSKFTAKIAAQFTKTESKTETWKHTEDMEKLVGLIDAFFNNSFIHIEDENSYFYVVAMKSGGILNMNTCLYEIALEPEVLNVTTYAREGIVRQNTCEKGMKNLREFLKLTK